jgi:hypothetical protein
MFADLARRCDCGDERRDAMEGRGTKLVRVAVLSVATALLFAIAGVASATPASTGRCAQFKALRGVFPKPTAVGLTSRTAVTRQAPKDPILPGYCGTWSATYREGAGIDREVADADTSLTLYKTHKQAVREFERTSGQVKRLVDGGLVRITNKGLRSLRKKTVEVVSIYRNVFINSHSTALVTPIWSPDQLRLHRRIQAGVRAING